MGDSFTTHSSRSEVLRNDIVQEQLCFLAGLEDHIKADCPIKPRRMGIARGLILPLLEHHKFVPVVVLLITDVADTSGVLGARW